MIIKKFTGKTEAEATEAARKELGSGVVIMSVRQIKPKGAFFGIQIKTDGSNCRSGGGTPTQRQCQERAGASHGVGGFQDQR